MGDDFASATLQQDEFPDGEEVIWQLAEEASFCVAQQECAWDASG